MDIYLVYLLQDVPKKHPRQKCNDNDFLRTDIKFTISPAERSYTIVNHQGHLPYLKQQMQINNAVLLCRLTSKFITKCSKKARQKEKYAFCIFKL